MEGGKDVGLYCMFMLMHILSVVSRVIDKGGGEHQVVKDCRIFSTKVHPNTSLAPKGDPL